MILDRLLDNQNAILQHLFTHSALGIIHYTLPLSWLTKEIVNSKTKCVLKSMFFQKIIVKYENNLKFLGEGIDLIQ